MIRNDLDVPVFVFETESDVLSSNLADRQPDTAKFRLWEVAGTAHYDHYGLLIGPDDTGNGKGAVKNLAAMQHPLRTIPIPGSATFSCNLPINTGGAHWVLDAAVYSLNQWVVNGTLPPHGPLMKTTGVSPVVFAHDANGNVRGGVRSPQVDAPIAKLGGVGNNGTGPVGKFCFLFGTTVPFNASKLASLYKNHAQFVSKWNLAATNAVKGGFLRPLDAVELEKAAAASKIPKESGAGRPRPPRLGDRPEDGFGNPVAGHAAEDEALRDDGLGVGGHRAPTLRTARIRRCHRRRHRVGSANLRADLLPLLSEQGRRVPAADRPTKRRAPRRARGPAARRAPDALAAPRARGTDISGGHGPASSLDAVIVATPNVVKAVLGGIQLNTQRVIAEFFGSRLGLPSDALVPTMLAAAAQGVIQAAQTQWFFHDGDLATTISECLEVLERGIGTDPKTWSPAL